MKSILELIAWVVTCLIVACLLAYFSIAHLFGGSVIPQDAAGNAGSLLQGTLGVAVALGGSLVAIRIAEAANRTIEKQAAHELEKPYKQMAEDILHATIGLRFEIGKLFSINRAIAQHISSLDKKVNLQYDAELDKRGFSRLGDSINRQKEKKNRIDIVSLNSAISCLLDDLSKYLESAPEEKMVVYLRHMGMQMSEISRDVLSMNSRGRQVAIKEYVEGMGPKHEELDHLLFLLDLYADVRKRQIKDELKKTLLEHNELKHISTIFIKSLSSLSAQIETCAKNPLFCHFLARVGEEKGIAKKISVEMSDYSGDGSSELQDSVKYSKLSQLIELFSMRVELMTVIDKQNMSEDLIDNFGCDAKSYDLEFVDLDVQTGEGMSEDDLKRLQNGLVNKQFRSQRRICAYSLLSLGKTLCGRHATSDGFNDKGKITEGAFLFWLIANSVTWTDAQLNLSKIVLGVVLEPKNTDADLKKSLAGWICSKKEWLSGDFEKPTRDSLDDVEKLWAGDWDQVNLQLKKRNERIARIVLRGDLGNIEL